MRKTLIILFTGLFCSIHLFAQVQNEVNKILKTKDFVAFKKYADNLYNSQKGISSHWVYLRELIPQNNEGVFFFEKSVPDKDDPAISTVYFFRVTIVATKIRIIYYELSEEKNKKVGDEWKPYYSSIDKFKDDAAFENLKASFKKIYKADFNENELFITDFVYGKRCGWAGADPAGRRQIDRFVAKKDKAKLLDWLKSTNTEKQIYAADGLYQLKELGVKLTNEELEIIKFVINKKGNMKTCSGCTFFQNDISHVTGQFAF